MSERGSRAAKVRRVQELRAQQLPYQAIAYELGVSASYVRDMLYDPDGSKQAERKQGRRQPCPDCGRLMGIPGSLSSQPQRCYSCARKHEHEQRYWTRERIIEGLQRLGQQLGRMPVAEDCRLGNIKNGRPGTTFVMREFGSWNAGLLAAGFDPQPRGKYPRDQAWRDRIRKRAWPNEWTGR